MVVSSAVFKKDSLKYCSFAGTILRYAVDNFT